MSDDDTRDPLRAAIEDYRRAPRDVVPRQPVTDNSDLEALDGHTVEIVHYDATVDGVTRHTDRVTITRPITS